MKAVLAFKKGMAMVMVAGAFVLLSACATTTKSDNYRLEAVVKPNVSMSLPKLKVEPFSSEEFLTAHYGDKTENLLTVLDFDGSNLNLEALSPSGIRLLGANFDGTKITTNKYINIENLPDGAQVLFDILLCHAKLEDIKAVLPQGYSIEDANKERILKDDAGNVLYQITYADDDTNYEKPKLIENKVFNYSIELEQLN